MTETRDRRFTPARADIAAEKLRGIVEARQYREPRCLRVVTEVVSLSSSPARDVPIDTEALFGELVDVYDIDEEGWAWGQLRSDDYVGYMPAEALRDLAGTPSYRVRTLRAHVYPGPDMKLPPILALPLGARVLVSEARGDFLVAPGFGYVWANHLARIDEFEDDFVAVAERFLHVPYLWGGKTCLGVDCSGLAQVSLGAAGVDAPRDTDVMERAVGAAITFDATLSGLRRGDLVFWKGHVGVMRDACELIHANGHHMQVVSEPLRVARDRIFAKTGGDITSIRRP